jgi:thiamine biosynthesis lipoprotein
VSDDRSRRSVPLMGTIITIDVPAGEGSTAAVERAFQWFRQVERCCSRFDPQSELLHLTRSGESAVPVSDMLFEAVRFAVGMAEESGGAFDPTIGASMETLGFNQEYSTKQVVRTGIEPDSGATYRDVLLDPEGRTITLLRPLVLDLGAVAKGMAMDLAARELQPFGSFSIDAGGDLFMGGCSPSGSPWTVGIRHPRLDGELIGVIEVSDSAVCTSGDYERRQGEAPNAEHHILHPQRGKSARGLASATVVGPTAMLADAAATAAFVLGPEEGIRFLDRLELDGLLISPALDQFATEGMSREYKLGTTAIL